MQTELSVAKDTHTQKQHAQPSTGLVKPARVSLSSKSSRKSGSNNSNKRNRQWKRSRREKDWDGVERLAGSEKIPVRGHRCISRSYCFPRIKAFHQMSWGIEPVWHNVKCVGTFAPGWEKVYREKKTQNNSVEISALTQAHTGFVDRHALACVTYWKAVITYRSSVTCQILIWEK